MDTMYSAIALLTLNAILITWTNVFALILNIIKRNQMLNVSYSTCLIEWYKYTKQFKGLPVCLEDNYCALINSFQ